MKAKFLALVLLPMLLVGCVTKQPFIYDYSPLAQNPGKKSLGVLPPLNERFVQNDLDKVLDLPKGLADVLVREMESTGHFSAAMPVTKLSAERGATDYLLTIVLRQFDWQIPDRDEIAATSMGVAAATGAVGGLVYGSTSTEVSAVTRIGLRLTTSKGAVILSKEYIGHATMKTLKMNCDAPGTGRKIAGKALKDVVDQFKRDLQTVKFDK